MASLAVIDTFFVNRVRHYEHLLDFLPQELLPILHVYYINTECELAPPLRCKSLPNIWLLTQPVFNTMRVEHNPHAFALDTVFHIQVESAGGPAYYYRLPIPVEHRGRQYYYICEHLWKICICASVDTTPDEHLDCYDYRGGSAYPVFRYVQRWGKRCGHPDPNHRWRDSITSVLAAIRAKEAFY